MGCVTSTSATVANKGYHILLEKPMAVNETDCRAIVEAVKRNHVILAVGHVLRYTPYSQTIKEIIDSGRIGRIINIQHLEPVVRLSRSLVSSFPRCLPLFTFKKNAFFSFGFLKGFWHFAHSYVRGPWRSEKEATFSLMAKVLFSSS